MKRIVKPKLREGLYTAPLEQAFRKVLSPFDEFIQKQYAAGLVLIIATLVALYIANSPYAAWYQHLLQLPVLLRAGDWQLQMDIHSFVNEGLMSLFFFLVGLELKYELLSGALAEPKKAALPIIAAFGGMVFPAVIYRLANPDGIAVHGWGVPMATDIAFAVGAMMMLGSRVPKNLIAFLLAFAVVDDLGAVVVIAVFYTQEIVPHALHMVLWMGFLLLLLNRAGVRHGVPYGIVSLLMWFYMLQSGIHATLAGVAAAFMIPAYPRFNHHCFSGQLKDLAGQFDASVQVHHDVVTNEELHGLIQTIKNGVHAAETPLQRMQSVWGVSVYFVILPVFALVNAGIPLSADIFSVLWVHPVAWGVVGGLVLGKFLGISLSSWLAVRLGIARLPSGIRFSQIAGVSLIGGIGFTMAIFMAQLSFAHQETLLVIAKASIVLASIVAALTGTFSLWWLFSREKNTQRDVCNNPC